MSICIKFNNSLISYAVVRQEQNICRCSSVLFLYISKETPVFSPFSSRVFIPTVYINMYLNMHFCFVLDQTVFHAIYSNTNWDIGFEHRIMHNEVISIVLLLLKWPSYMPKTYIIPIEPHDETSWFMSDVNNKDTDQPVHRHCLIRAFE